MPNILEMENPREILLRKINEALIVLLDIDTKIVDIFIKINSHLIILKNDNFLDKKIYLYASEDYSIFRKFIFSKEHLFSIEKDLIENNAKVSFLFKGKSLNSLGKSALIDIGINLSRKIPSFKERYSYTIDLEKQLIAIKHRILLEKEAQEKRSIQDAINALDKVLPSGTSILE